MCTQQTCPCVYLWSLWCGMHFDSTICLHAQVSWQCCLNALCGCEVQSRVGTGSTPHFETWHVWAIRPRIAQTCWPPLPRCGEGSIPLFRVQLSSVSNLFFYPIYVNLPRFWQTSQSLVNFTRTPHEMCHSPITRDYYYRSFVDMDCFVCCARYD